MTEFLELLGAQRSETGRGLRFGDVQGELVSYGELWRRARAQAGMLSHLPVGSRVLIVGDNSQAQVEALLACWWSGLTPACVAPPARLSPGQVYHEQLRAWANASQAQMGLCEADLWERCAPTELPHGWARLPLEAGPEVAARAGGSAYVQFSSGTTLAPRPVELAPSHLCHNIRAILQAISLRAPLERHSCVSWLPLYHDMGLVGSLLSAFAAGGDLLLLRPYQFAARPQLWLQALGQTRATISPAPNFALAQCLERVRDEQLEGCDLSSWMLALLGSETIQPPTLRAFYERFKGFGLRWESLTPVYGLAEATLAVTFSPPGRGPRFLEVEGRELVSLGPALEGIEVEIREGAIWTRSPSATVAPGEWLDTGDLGFFDEGELFLTGRAKDILIVRGKNYAAETLEQPLLGVGGLEPSRAAALMVDDEVVVVAELPRKVPPDPGWADAARSRIAEQTGLLARVVLVESGWLPRTTSGKIRRSAVAAKLKELHA